MLSIWRFQPFTITASYDDNAIECGLAAGSRFALGTYRIDGIPEDLVAAAAADASKTPRVR